MFVYYTKESGLKEVSHSAYEKISGPNEKHPCLEILLITEGQAKYSFEGEKHILNRYDLVILPFGTKHFGNAYLSKNFEGYLIKISPEDLNKMFSKLHIINIANDILLLRMFKQLDMYNELYDRVDFSQAALFLVNEMLIYLSHIAQTQKQDGKAIQSEPMITKITAYIEKNLQNELNSDIIAEYMKFSKSYVQNQFSAKMKMGLQEYINTKKVKAAHEEIQNGMAPSHAAAKYNFHDYSSFYRHYKKVFGSSPKNNKGKY